MKKVGSGQITITDLIDGELTVELSSNLSRVQIYSSSAGLSPDWTVENLKLTPTVRFNGKTIDISNKDLTITYLKKINSQSITKLDGTSELIDEGTKQLVVNQNNLNNENSENILYICAVTYKLNDNIFSAQASIMFSLLKNGQNGGDAYTVLLTNESHSFAGSETAALDSSTTTSIIGYKGSIEQNVKIKKVNNINASTSSISTGITGLNFKVSSVNFVKQPSITFYTTTQLITKSGTIPIVIEIDGKEFTKNFSFSVSYKGKQGEDASIVNLVASQQFFKSSDGNSFSPDIITITPDFQNCSFSSWYYSTNGGTSWIQITNTTSSSTDCYFDNTTKVLYIPKGFSKYNSSVTAIGFKCQSNIESVYDNITIAKIYDANSINIDSENYILNGGFYNAKNSWEATDTSSIITVDGKNWLRFYDNVGSTVTKVFRQSRSNIWATSPKQFVVSFDAQNVQVDSSVSTNYLWMMDITFIGNNLYKASKYVNLTSEKKHFTFKIETTVENITGFTIDCYALATNQKCDVRFTNLQLEIGNKETNWKPSSNDAFQVITKLQTKYDKDIRTAKDSITIESKRVDTLTTSLTDKDGNIINVSNEVDKLTGKIETVKGLVSLSVTRENLARGIKDGTTLSLNANMVRIAWNQVSSYWEFIGSGSEKGLNLYWSGKSRIFNFNDNYLSFYDASATYNSSSSSYTTYDKLLSRFDRKDWIFYTGKESVGPRDSTSKYKVCSIGKNYFQIFDGTSNSTQLAVFNSSGIQLNDTSGNKRVTVNNSGMRNWYNGIILAEYGSNGVILKDSNGTNKLKVKSSGIELYKSNGSNLAATMGSGGIELYAQEGLSDKRMGAIISNKVENSTNYGMTMGVDYYTYYLSLARKASSSSDAKWSPFVTYYNASFSGWAYNDLVFDCHPVFLKSISLRGGVGVSAGTTFEVYNNVNLDFYSELDMHGFGIANSSFVSDGRLKKDIRTTSFNALDAIKQMSFRQFTWKEDDKKETIGLIAQELEQIESTFVNHDYKKNENNEVTEDIYFLELVPLVSTALKGIQEQQKVIESQQETIEYLKETINELLGVDSDLVAQPFGMARANSLLIDEEPEIIFEGEVIRPIKKERDYPDKIIN